MSGQIYSIINGTGSYIPQKIVHNEDFLSNTFYDKSGSIIQSDTHEIIKKFEQITAISERRYIDDNLVTSDIASIAAEDAIKSSNTDPESLDYIIAAHNFGDVRSNNRRTDIVPSIASRVKAKLNIKNPSTVAYDVIFGCPGWLQGVIQADYFIKSGDAKKVMVIGAECLSRVSDMCDRDSMLYSDGAGAVIFEAKESQEPIGILSHAARTDAVEYVKLLEMDKSYNPDENDKELFLKMNGRKLYEYALNYVPQLVKSCIERAKLSLQKINKVLIHQAHPSPWQSHSLVCHCETPLRRRGNLMSDHTNHSTDYSFLLLILFSLLLNHFLFVFLWQWHYLCHYKFHRIYL